MNNTLPRCPVCSCPAGSHELWCTRTEGRAMNETSKAFNAWWDSDKPELGDNPFRPDSAAYWAWAGWQSASERAAKVCEGLQVNKSPDYYPGQAFDGACRTCAAAIRKGEAP